MATAAYSAWVRGGRVWYPATPIAEYRALAAAAGVPFLGDIGSDDTRHLQAARPQDHTPFPANPWPGPLPGPYVTAIDLGRGAWCDRYLADCRAGLCPWVKYLNFGGHHYDSRNGWQAEPSDDEHCHTSIRSDWCLRSIGAYNPFAATGKAVPRMFVVEKRLSSGSSWAVTDGLRWRPLITWNEVLTLRSVTGRPTDVVVTNQQAFDLLCGSQDAPEGSTVEHMSDAQVDELVSRLNGAIGIPAVRQVLREELGAVRLTPGGQ